MTHDGVVVGWRWWMVGVRLLETLRLDQTKNSKRLSAVLRRWSCLTFNTTNDAADVHAPPPPSNLLLLLLS